MIYLIHQPVSLRLLLTDLSHTKIKSPGVYSPGHQTTITATSQKHLYHPSASFRRVSRQYPAARKSYKLIHSCFCFIHPKGLWTGPVTIRHTHFRLCAEHSISPPKCRSFPAVFYTSMITISGTICIILPVYFGIFPIPDTGIYFQKFRFKISRFVDCYFHRIKSL